LPASLIRANYPAPTVAHPVTRRWRQLALSWLILPLAAAPAAEPVSSADRSVAFVPQLAKAQVLDLEATWLKAAQARDVAILRRVLSDDYVDISYKGIVRHKADALRAPALDVKRYVQRIDDEQIRLFGNAAIVTGHGVLRDQSGKRVGAWRFTDVFVKEGDGWQAVSSEETAEQ
jgi:ketosteroid isomerase-like protein